MHRVICLHILAVMIGVRVVPNTRLGHRMKFGSIMCRMKRSSQRARSQVIDNYDGSYFFTWEFRLGFSFIEKLKRCYYFFSDMKKFINKIKQMPWLFSLHAYGVISQLSIITSNGHVKLQLTCLCHLSLYVGFAIDLILFHQSFCHKQWIALHESIQFCFA